MRGRRGEGESLLAAGARHCLAGQGKRHPNAGGRQAAAAAWQLCLPSRAACRVVPPPAAAAAGLTTRGTQSPAAIEDKAARPAGLKSNQEAAAPLCGTPRALPAAGVRGGSLLKTAGAPRRPARLRGARWGARWLPLAAGSLPTSHVVVPLVAADAKEACNRGMAAPRRGWGHLPVSRTLGSCGNAHARAVHPPFVHSSGRFCPGESVQLSA